jgi:hypothetical protein
MRVWLAENPQEHPLWSSLRTQYGMMIRSNPELAAYTPERLFAEDLMGDGRHVIKDTSRCNIGTEMRDQMAFADVALRLAEFQQFAAWAEQEPAADGDSGDGDGGDGGDEPKDDKDKKAPKSLMDEWPETFIGPVVREIVAHEFGHTLGLRHNFKASTWKTMDEILDPARKDEATTASVMDYNAFVMNEDGSPPPNWVTPRVGPYDKWAIAYGYSVPGSSGMPRDEKAMLAKILERVGEPGLAYGTDEDMAKDPIRFHQVRMKVADTIEDGLLTDVVKEGEAMDKVRRAFQTLMWVRFQAASAAARYIGGYDINRYHMGDADGADPITTVDAKKQREAMEVLVDAVLDADAFGYDPEVLRMLSASRWSHRNSDSWSAPHLFPFQDTVLGYQTRVLFSLTNPERIQHVYDTAFFTDKGADVYSLPEMLDDLTTAIWSEVLEGKGGGSAKDPAIPHLRRNLQREHAGRLITIATGDENSGYPAVARTLAWKQLKDLGESIDKQIASKGKGMDPYSAAHLEETSARIAAALSAQYTIGGSGGGGVFTIMMGNEPNGPNAVIRPESPVLRGQNNPY